MNHELASKLAQAITARDELTAAIDRARSKPADEWPRVGDVVWYSATETVFSATWEGSEFDRCALARGNVYRTQSEAERADQRRIVEAELRKMARDAGPVVAGRAYEIRCGTKGWFVYWVAESSGMPRFPTRESAEAAIATITPARLDALGGDLLCC